MKLAETKTGELPKKFTQKTPDIDGIFFFVSLTEYNALPTPSEADEIISGSKKKRSKQTAEVKPQDQEQVRGWEESLQLWKKVTSNPGMHCSVCKVSSLFLSLFRHSFRTVHEQRGWVLEENPLSPRAVVFGRLTNSWQVTSWSDVVLTP